jgi:para-nitrobenzyl esterase
MGGDPAGRTHAGSNTARGPLLPVPLAGLAFHCLDIPFFFDALTEPGVPADAGPEPPQDLATRMHGALVRFVTDGDPGWERFGDGRSPVVIFDKPSEVRENPLELERAAWEATR